jgi:uncharacterized protein (TIGR03083 family)
MTMTDTRSDALAQPLSAGPALLAAIDDLSPSAPTACAGWTAHDIVAHLAAGAKELADLIEEKLDGRPERPTRGFEPREAPFRALSHDELRDRLVSESVRKLAAYDALRQIEDPTIAFTGTRISVDELETHSRSEASIHRWDLVGDDDASEVLLAPPELTEHAVRVLNRMPILDESGQALAARAAITLTAPIRIVFRSPDRIDVVFTASDGGGRFELADGDPATADAVVTTDPVDRLLVLWGRRSAHRSLEVSGAPAVVAAWDLVFLPRARPWPPR